MTSKERVLSVLSNKPVDHIPSGFWLHFPKEQQSGDAALTAHLDFWANTGADILKIMTESLVPCEFPISNASDWKKLKPFNRNSPFIRNQIELVKRIMASMGDDKVILTTVHGAVASLWHAYTGPDGYEENRGILARFLREDPEAMSHALQIVTDAQVIMVEEMLAAGVSGIYYAALGGESNMFTTEEFNRYIKPCDLRIMQAAANRPCMNVLHMCKDGLDLDRYADYPGDVVNWGICENNPGLDYGLKIFADKVILGGLDDRAGVLVDGPLESIEQQVYNVLGQMEGTRFLLGADCTLPTELPLEHIVAAVNATQKYANNNK